ncbi:MAG: hypothetical protein NC489_22280 [Ruminococcus flavefaciens]|nr:hypothetical protein [Ruminococcus flavefaciens]
MLYLQGLERKKKRSGWHSWFLFVLFLFSLNKDGKDLEREEEDTSFLARSDTFYGILFSQGKKPNFDQGGRWLLP